MDGADGDDGKHNPRRISLSLILRQFQMNFMDSRIMLEEFMDRVNRLQSIRDEF